ncbi:ABC transporter ATP-binding protein [Granulosicoccus antarcticus]|uniref:Sulfate/thiosulfate import ATP-binding protein CysA n=1 Tax=Granulosicoccus antarcticus IMCC3135 TaxID=1192854 RepID=A0A2Z2NR96_9GAMM|nr:ABC transporter ATP-binding protein [Granulosicoccus antarcticus]ASJ73015.1 Sulfate/thiosulfate import ATP-binding protein CysA [Granulosicoccus antarcticus IMCC3135]
MVDPVLDIRDIRKQFGALKASDGISLDLKQGEIHALIGPNGAGKSTLIGQIAGRLKPDSGSVHFLGQDISTQSTVQRARLGLGRTFQVSALAMENTVLENVVLGALGNRGKAFGFFKPVMHDKELLLQARAALERVELIDDEACITAELSHGQRRQLEVAVALTMQPKAFLMDEPMAGMGADGSKKLTKLLRELSNDAPILLVEHDMDAVFALADRISVLVYGKIIATGSVDEIRANPDVRTAYLGDEGGV